MYGIGRFVAFQDLRDPGVNVREGTVDARRQITERDHIQRVLGGGA